MNTQIIPIVVEALVLIKKCFDRHIKVIPSSPCLKEIRRIVLISTDQTLRRALSM